MTDLTINDALSRRRTIREFSEKRIPLDALERLIWAAQGITSLDGKRTAPSAHAIHPLQLFCLPNRVEGLEQRLYRVEADNLGFRHIDSRDDLREGLRQACIDAPSWITEAACIIAVCGDMVAPSHAFAEQRPFGSRGMRYVYLEAGAAAQNLHLQAVAEGLGCVWVGGFHDEATADILELRSPLTPLILICVGYPLSGTE
ncbi:nitroreductase family protein [Devosia pacifica]|uniref:nitroreductase family protein n=1 Tax=Devosia pacifica TaxID=1335967 RepID=UPI0016771E08|nr:nitroreductase family protein [Devosia pacifica]